MPAFLKQQLDMLPLTTPDRETEAVALQADATWPAGYWLVVGLSMFIPVVKLETNTLR